MPTANAVTGATGDRLVFGFDRSALFVDNAGEKLDDNTREVTYRGTFCIEDILYSDDRTNARLFERFSMLAMRVMEDLSEKELLTPVELYSSGKIREIRVGRKRWRSVGNSFKRVK